MARHVGTDLYDAFVAVAETGGFSAAVERLNRAQTTVSQQIKRLEELVGSDLFVRTNRNVELTAAGEALLPYARKILLLNEQAAQAVSANVGDSVRIGIPDIYSQGVLPNFIELFRSLDDRVAPVVCCDHSMQLLAQFSSGTLDVILAGRCRGCELGQTLRTEELVWVGSDDLELKNGSPVPLILSADGCPFRERALAALRQEDIQWEIVYTGQSSAAINPSLMHGLGLTAMPKRLIPRGLEDLGEKLGLPRIQAAPIDLHVGMALVDRYGEEIKASLEEAAMAGLVGPVGYGRMSGVSGVAETAVPGPPHVAGGP